MKDKQTIENKAQLVELFEAGCKPARDWWIGTEHEKFCYDKKTRKPLPYEGEKGIAAVLEGFTPFGWKPVKEKGKTIGLLKDGASVTLEPAGQLELSGALLKNIHETCNEVHSHLYQAKEVGEQLGVGYLGLGFHPTMTREDATIMPKGRYDIMRAYMPKKGNLGLDMMLRTATVQVNLDFSDERDMARKFHIGMALQPLATALFANSPFTEGKPNGYKSYRSHVWTDTDPDRTGILPFVFDENFSFERYVDYALDVPMYFVHRDSYIDAAGQSFRNFLKGELPALPGEKPTFTDWNDHLTTIFPEVRMKTFLEMRGADGGPWSNLCALPALWVGLLYDQTAMDAAYDLIRDWTPEDVREMRNRVPKMGFDTPWKKGTFRDLGWKVLEIADQGLKNRNKTSQSGETEQGFLEILRNELEHNKTPADDLLEAYYGPWKEDISHIFGAQSY